MARKRREKVTIRRNKSEQYLVNLKYYGPEPEVDGVELNDARRANALNWYGAMAEVEDYREYLAAYLANRPDQFKVLTRVPDNRLNYTVAALARMVTRGGILPAKSREWLEAGLAEMLRRAEPPKVVPTAKADVPKVITIQDRMREQASDVMGELNGMIDDGVITPGWSLYDYATKNQWTGMLAKRIADKFRPMADELLEALAGTDDQLNEAYKMPRKRLVNLAATYQGLVDDADRFAGNAVKARAPRRKRRVMPDKVVAKLNYAKANDTYQLKSVSPVKIIGASELWTFNGKTNVLTVFRARTRDGLTVKGSSIKGFDPETSEAKKMGRKTKERLDKVLNGGKVALRKIMDDFIGTKIKGIGRINKDTILLRVVS